MLMLPNEVGIQYGYWRTDKEPEPGFSHELISMDIAGSNTDPDLDKLDFEPFPGVNTLYKAMLRNIEIMPGADMIGSRIGDKYEWITWRECLTLAEDFGHGVKSMRLCGEVGAEGRTWNFVGIQSKNRREWQIINIGAMF